MSLQCTKKEMSYEVDVLYTDKHKSLLQGDNIFDGFGQACRKYLSKFAISLWHKKEARNEVRDLTALADSDLTFTIYYTSNVLWPLTLFLSLNMESIPSLFFIWYTHRNYWNYSKKLKCWDKLLKKTSYQKVWKMQSWNLISSSR